MTTIISGGRDAGKTRRILALYGLTRIGDGLCMPKVILPDGGFLGYDIARLSGGAARPLARLAKKPPPGWDEHGQVGRFTFSALGFGYAADVVADILGSGTNPVYLDEIGPLELNGKGLAPLLARIVAAGRDLVLTARPSLVSDIRSAFGLAGARVIRLSGRSRTGSGSSPSARLCR